MEGGQRFLCTFPDCGKSFTQKRNLRRHEKLHDQNRERFYCQMGGCPASFSRRSDLRVHERSHSKVIELCCSFNGCTRTFSRSSDLLAHERRHRNDRPHICGICDKGFGRPCDLRTHMVRMHRVMQQPALSASVSPTGLDLLTAAALHADGIVPLRPPPKPSTELSHDRSQIWTRASLPAGSMIAPPLPLVQLPPGNHVVITDAAPTATHPQAPSNNNLLPTALSDADLDALAATLTESLGDDLPQEEDALRRHLCPWTDCACGTACTCLKACRCGSRCKTDEDWTTLLDGLKPHLSLASPPTDA
eukprot:TRINITY_DN8299_c0_g2_i5.p2 TRINITY_DN8299_c0_g2~~TRINITY_DN8299_c0_g2_i5.p2  ORF type:complete len:305 (+),score=0.76 TRINITY_DN8299_c0_g2_i5:117-1031(+)